MDFTIGQFYKSRDGRKAQIFMLDNGRGYTLGAIKSRDNTWSTCSWYSDGMFRAGKMEHDLDLVGEWREPIKKVMEVYINKDKTRIELDYTSQMFVVRLMSPNKTEYFDTKVRIDVTEVPE